MNIVRIKLFDENTRSLRRPRYAQRSRKEHKIVTLITVPIQIRIEGPYCSERSCRFCVDGECLLFEEPDENGYLATAELKLGEGGQFERCAGCCAAESNVWK